jgi:hypothetical protein
MVRKVNITMVQFVRVALIIFLRSPNMELIGAGILLVIGGFFGLVILYIIGSLISALCEWGV